MPRTSAPGRSSCARRPASPRPRPPRRGHLASRRPERRAAGPGGAGHPLGGADPGQRLRRHRLRRHPGRPRHTARLRLGSRGGRPRLHRHERARGGGRPPHRGPALPAARGAGRLDLRPAGRPLPARLVGIDRETDLAVLKVEAEGLVPLPFAEPEELRQGQLVLAFGSPLGLDNSVTLGRAERARAPAQARRPDDLPADRRAHQPRQQRRAARGRGGPPRGHQHPHPQPGRRQRGPGLRRPRPHRPGGRARHPGRGPAAPGLDRGPGADRDAPPGRRASPPDEAAVIVSDVVADTPAARADLRIGDLVPVVDGRPLDNARQFDVRLYRAAPARPSSWSCCATASAWWRRCRWWSGRATPTVSLPR